MSKDENLAEVNGVKTFDLIKRLSYMMEAFANRMSTLENKMWKGNGFKKNIE